VLAALPAMAREYSPRVVSPHNADAYSMRAFREFHRWRDLQNDELAWEVYKYLVDHRHFTIHNYANGRFVYEPNLSERSTDFVDGIYESRNIRTSAEGLTLGKPGEGFAIFEVRTLYWHYNAHREVRLKEPADRVYVRYVGDPAINNFCVYAHCLDDRRQSAAPVTITHAWAEERQTKNETIRLSGPGSYEILTGGDPVDEWIEISVPSDSP